MSTNTIEKLAQHGIDVDNNGKLLQDKSVQLYQDGHLHDFGRGGKHYFNVDNFIEARKDLHDAPVQANTSLKVATPKYNVENIYNGHKIQLRDLDNSFKSKLFGEFIPLPFWDKENLPKSIGYDFKNNSLTVSVFDGDNIVATTIRRSAKVKWRTYGSKTFIPTRLTGKKDVYLASGMSEIVLMDLMQWDYIGLQADGMVKHLQEPADQIQHLIILPDNDESFMNKVNEIVSILSPKRASIVNWEYPDPRDAATAYGTPEALQQAINENLEPLEVIATGDEDKIIELKPVLTPVNPVEFANRLKAQLIEFNPKFVVGDRMMKVFNDYASIFNSVVNENTANSIGRRHVVPLATGSAKTTAAKLYMAMCGVSGIVVVRKAMTAVEVVRDINMMAGEDIARCYYSPDAQNGRPDTAERVNKDELSSYQVIVITHAMFERVHDTTDVILNNYRLYNGDNRKAVIIDERIDLKREESFDNKEVDDLIALLCGADTTGKYTKHIEGLSNLNELIFTNENIESPNKSNFTMWEKDMRKIMVSGLDVFNDLIKALDTKELVLTERTYIRGLRNRGSDSMKYEEASKALMKRMMFVVTGFMMNAKQGTTTIISRVEDYSLLFGAVVILDATANVNKVYEVFAKYQSDQFTMYDKPAIRNYQNVTLHIAHGIKQSKLYLYGATGKMTATERTIYIVKRALDSIYPLVGKDDNMLVVVHKSAMPIFKEHNRMPNVTFINWGQHAGSNQWSHYNKAFIFGWYRIPPYITANNRNAAAGGYHNLDISNYDKDVKEMADSAIADDMVQFFNRTRTRVSTDEEGNCEPVDLYMMTDDTKTSSSIISRTVKEFDHMEVVDWDITLDTSTKKKRPKAEERADNIIALLKMSAQKHDDVMANIIREQLGTNKAAFSRTISSDYMQKELEYFNIKYKRLEGSHGSPFVFDFSEAKNL